MLFALKVPMQHTRYRSNAIASLLFGLAAGLIGSACSDTGSSGAECPGAAGCPCAAMEACDIGLVCITAGYCVYPGGGTDGGSTGSGSAEGTPGDSTGAASGAPVIVELTLMTEVVTFRESDVSITALVTDPDGLEDIVGGTVSAPDGPVIGPFVQVGGGTFSFVGLYSQLLDAGLTNNDADVVLEVEFIDVVGNSVVEQVSLTVCDDDYDFCDGDCRDMQNDPMHCGWCDWICSSNGCCSGGDCQDWC